MSEPVDRNLSRDSNRRGMQKFGNTRAGERDAEQETPVEIDANARGK